MRFTKEKEMRKLYWNHAEKIKTKFLWFPVDIDGEIRWLERATIKYRVRSHPFFFGNEYYSWTLGNSLIMLNNFIIFV